MRYRICRFSIKYVTSLFLIFGLTFSMYAQKRSQGQALKNESKKRTTVIIQDTIPLYNGTYVGVDIYGLGSKLLGGDFISSEVNVGVNLKNKFIPTFEFGMGGTDSWGDTGIHYKSKMAPYFRIGLDYNVMSKKKEKNSFLYVGMRYALSNFTYDIESMPITDPIWGDQIPNPGLTDDIWKGSVAYNHPGLKGSMQWVELVLGVKVKIYKNFNMGWTVRMKYKTASSVSEFGNPWYVPGYGEFKSNNIGLTYSLIYKLPF